jgi:hypothetical protein
MVEIVGMGAVLFIYKSGEHRLLNGVYLIPKLTINIISLDQLDEAGFKVSIKAGVMWVFDEQNIVLAKVVRSMNQLYLLGMDIAQPMSLVAKGADGAWLWHSQFGHLNFLALNKLAREGLVRGMPEIEHIDQLCTGGFWPGNSNERIFPARQSTGPKSY